MSLFYNYNKPGPGVSKNGPQKNRFFLFFELYFRKFWKLCQLNIIYFVFCLPIITIGPATAAYTYILRNFAREEHAFVWWDFKDAFKSNFKQGFVTGLIELVLTFTFIININFYRQILNAENVPTYILVMMGAMIIIYLFLMFMRPYVYLMIVTIQLPLKHIFKNAFIFTILGFFRNLFSFIGKLLSLFFITLLSVIILGPIVDLVPSIVIGNLLFLPFITLSLLGFISVYNAYPIIKKYLIDVQKTDDDDNTETIFSDELIDE